MRYNKGDFYLINNYNEEINLNKFIGEIIQFDANKIYTLKIYIFPESTKEGRKSYMSSNEVFSTERNITYQFIGKNEMKIELIKFERYLNIKLKNQQMNNNIYFYRQSYSFKTQKFTPENLPLICYCKKIFNPDLSFKQCVCGNIFHIDCFLKANTNECWAKNCNYNCNNFLDYSQKLQKVINKAEKNNEINNNNINNDKIEINSNKKFFYQYEYKINKNDLLNRKTERKYTNDILNIYNDNSLSLSKRATSSNTIKSISDKNEKNLINIKKQKSSIIDRKIQNIQDNINRDKGQSLIYNVLEEGYNLIQNNPILKNQYRESNETNKITNFNLNKFAKQIEENLYSLYKSNSSSYMNFLQEFNKIKKDSKDLLFKIILGNYSPKQISNFTTDDFLSKEKKLEKQNQKLLQIEQMKYKNEKDRIEFSMGKGNLLTERQDFTEINENVNENINLNLKNNPSEEVLEKQKQFPYLKIYDIKNLISMETPSKQNIKQRLEQMLKQNLDINSINYFKEKRKKMLLKEAKILMNQKNKKNNNNSNGIKENIKNNPESKSKINEYIEKISFMDLKI